jgi:hypothetical protein
MSGDTAGQPATPGAIPAGWYPDPAGSEAKRWWDGGRWTDQLQQPEEPPPPSTFGTFVHAEFRPTQPLPVAEAGVAYTRTSWWLASSPIWILVPQGAVVGIIDSLAPPPPLSSVIPGLILLNLLAWAILVRLAFADRRGLINGGNNTTASPWWTLLTPLAYLIVRARQVELYASGGWVSVLWWSIAAFVSPGLAVLGLFAAFGLNPV